MSEATRHLLISSVAAILVAAITSLAALVTATGQLKSAAIDANSAATSATKATESAESATRAVHVAIPSVPVGAIVASTLSWRDFASASGSEADFSAAKSLWAPCDGRVLLGSTISNAYHVERAPDLRSVFLRGLNEFVPGAAPQVDSDRADPESSRLPGSYQSDEFRKHAHDMGYHKWGLASGNGTADLERSKQLPTVKTGETGGAETRPKNVAVYYYIRIN